MSDSPFTIENLRPVQYGKVRATFDLRVGPILLLDCRMVVDDAEAPKFISPARIKEHYTQAYRATAVLDREFAASVLEDVVERLAAEVSEVRRPARRSTKGSTEARDAWADDQDTKFEAARAAL